jgi:hypothetical protein
MAYRWHFVDLTDEQVAARRTLLDRYGIAGQLSCLAPIALYWVYRLGIWVFHERQYEHDHDPTRKPKSKSVKEKIRAGWRKDKWYLGGRFNVGGADGGQRGLWFAGIAWSVWLGFLSVHNTGNGKSPYSYQNDSLLT